MKFSEWVVYSEAGLFHQKHNPQGYQFGDDTPGDVAADAVEEQGKTINNLAAYFELVKQRLSSLWPNESNALSDQMMKRYLNQGDYWQWRRHPYGSAIREITSSIYSVNSALKRQANSLRKYKNIDHSLKINYEKGLSKALNNGITVTESVINQEIPKEIKEFADKCLQIFKTTKQDIDTFVARFINMQ